MREKESAKNILSWFRSLVPSHSNCIRQFCSGDAGQDKSQCKIGCIDRTLDAHGTHCHQTPAQAEFRLNRPALIANSDAGRSMSEAEREIEMERENEKKKRKRKREREREKGHLRAKTGWLALVVSIDRPVVSQNICVLVVDCNVE